ncbi:MAG: hypothetical protein BWY70_00850 [Bacteroidetes bacterium ADurb.Bin408]|nr:MAG: hypothetical protein BWY70_00850 [Bacteroidetes bacterium ADurb.Bin408]
MNKELISEGVCIYCQEKIKQQQMTKHIAEHLTVLEKEKKTTGTGAWHIKIESGEMFLHLLVSGNDTFKNLDKFLRDIWVECCGHLSSFSHKNFKVKMADSFDNVLSPLLKILYEYDFGDTTYLDVIALKRYQITAPQKITLLSRNEPLKLMCSICGKVPAVVICPFCCMEEYALFCAKCSHIHTEECDDFDEDMALPVVNSPRMGVCGYEGGVIDKQRDGVYEK